jgi:endogenous inhibitor of DNA gyrase (YacG/DUF329 family)
MTDAELLPCPFCGAAPDFGEDTEGRSSSTLGHPHYYVECGCPAGPVVFGQTQVKANAAWNRRAPDQAAHARGAAEERAAVVAWLRRFETIDAADILTDTIARGEHRREGVMATCPKCGRTSHNPNDIRAENRYCGACHEFFDAPDAKGGG